MRKSFLKHTVQSRWVVSVSSAVLLAVLGVVDALTSREIAISDFYLLPIIWTAWWAGRRAGLILAVFGTTIWVLADLWNGAFSRPDWVELWNALMLLTVFVIVAHLVDLVRQNRVQLEAIVQKRTAALSAEVVERKRIAVELRAANVELKTAQWQVVEAAKLETLGRLAAGIAHEVRNPLAIVGAGIAELQREPIGQSPGTAQTLRDMNEGVRRADSVISGMLDLATPRNLELHATELNPLIENSLRLVKHTLDRSHVQVEKHLDPAPLQLWLDGQKIEQLLVNLFTNAIHAMPTGGTLRIRTGTRPFRAQDWTGTVGSPGQINFPEGKTVVAIEIEDTGTGIPPQHLEKIFEPFFTTKPTGQGTGLGLTVSRRIIEPHGGLLTIGNRPEGGVRATILLPV
jgi:signal transduction histidine kinase